MKNFKWEENLTRLIMICVGIICLFLSIYFSTEYYIQNINKPFSIAVSLALAVASFNTFSLTACSFLKKSNKKPLAITLAFLAILTISYDIVTIVGAQSAIYAQKEGEAQKAKEKVSEQEEQKGEFNIRLEEINEDINTLTEDIKNKKKDEEYETNQKKEIELKLKEEREKPEEEQNKSLISSYNRKLKEIKVNIDNLKKERKSLESEREKLKTEKNSVRQERKDYNKASEEDKEIIEYFDNSFSAWVSVVTSLPKNKIQLFLVLIPALFIDLISPIAMSFGLSLNSRKVIKKKEEEVDINDKPESNTDQVPIVEDKPQENLPVENKIENKIESKEKVEEKAPVVKRTRKPKKKTEELEKLPTEEQIVVEKKSPFLTPKEVAKQNKEENQEDLVNFKFGKTTQIIMNKLIDFISLCINNAGDFELHPDVAAQRLSLGDKAKKVFLDRLSALRLNSEPLIERNKYGEYVANFNAKEIIDFVSEIKND